MKKTIILSIFCAIPFVNFAQWTGTNPESTNSDVGIQTNTPNAYLHVSPTYTGGGIYPPVKPLLQLDYTSSGLNYPVLFAYNTGLVGIGISSPLERFHVLGNSLVQGNSIIEGGSLTLKSGTINNFKVTASGFVTARQVDVHLSTIPDYVFHAAFNKDSAVKYEADSSYKMLSIEQVDTFVRANRHLPGIKSASEYQQAGAINIGELQLQMLQKIEELTLYNIQLKNELEELKKKINSQPAKP